LNNIILDKYERQRKNIILFFSFYFSQLNIQICQQKYFVMNKILYLFIFIYMIRFYSSARVQQKTIIIFEFDRPKLYRRYPTRMQVDIRPKEQNKPYYLVSGIILTGNKMNVESIQCKLALTNQNCSFTPSERSMWKKS